MRDLVPVFRWFLGVLVSPLLSVRCAPVGFLFLPGSCWSCCVAWL